ncbi:hypothetical protein K523DRAFT_295806 [Schizophyllum commune Tattone D]|nr:hypothetical protein K523DRAFT_295806 [Schizophyllum commune Tattone D]
MAQRQTIQMEPSDTSLATIEGTRSRSTSLTIEVSPAHDKKVALRILSDSATPKAWEDTCAQYAMAWSDCSSTNLDIVSGELASSEEVHFRHLREPAEWLRTPLLKALAMPDTPISPISAMPSPLLLANGRALPANADSSIVPQNPIEGSEFQKQQDASPSALVQQPASGVFASLCAQDLENRLVESQSTPVGLCDGLGLGLPGVLSTSWSAQKPLSEYSKARPTAEENSAASPSGSYHKLSHMRSLRNIRGSPSPRPRSPLSPKSLYTRAFTPRIPFGQSLQNVHSPSPVQAASPVCAASPVFDYNTSLIAASSESIASICLADELEASFQLGGMPVSPALF